MQTEKPTSSSATNNNAQPERFWTWGTKLLVLLNIVFLLAIGAGIVIVFKALKPSIQAYTENIDLK